MDMARAEGKTSGFLEEYAVNPRRIVQDQICHRETEQIPYVLVFDPEVRNRLDEHYGGRAWRDQLTTYIARSNKIALIMKAEPLPRVKDVFGTIWRRDVLPPVVVEPALKSPSFEGYAFPLVSELLDPDAKARAKILADESDAFVAVNTGFCLWESWYVRGFEETMMDSVTEEGFYTELLDRIMHLTLEIIEECADISADAIMLGDDWGGQQGVLMGPERWRRYFKPRYARIFDAVHEQGKVAIMHCCGSVADIMADIVEIGLDVLESVQPEASGMNPYDLKSLWGDRITFWGCLGSQSTIPFAAPCEIRKEIRHLRSEMSKGGGYILAPAKPLQPETPTDNAVAVVEEFLIEKAR